MRHATNDVIIALTIDVILMQYRVIGNAASVSLPIIAKIPQQSTGPLEHFSYIIIC